MNTSSQGDRFVLADIIDHTFRLLQRLFRRIPIPYTIVGGFAGNVWGVARATLDIDVLVGGRPSQFDRLISLADRNNLQPRPEFLELNPLLRGFMVRCRIENLHVDFLRPRDVHDRNVLRRRRQATFAGHRLWFPTAEDLILMKLKVGRDRDFDDATRIVEQQSPNLNQDYLLHWAERLGIQDELRYALRDL